MKNEDLREILSHMNIIDRAYEVIRLVDPVNKRVVNYKDGSSNELQTKCFSFWSSDKACGNCISIRAIHENQTFVKVEHTGDRMFMITAVPLEVGNRKISIELMKDVTDSIVFGTDGNNSDLKDELYSMIDNLNRIAMQDRLTGLYNRRYIDEKMPVELINTAMAGQDLSVIIADIDFFKKVNDTYGHLIGDIVLKSFAEAIARCLKRESDWVARYGGEEFLICLPGAKLEKAVEIAELMRKSVENMEIISGDNVIKITSSFGIFSGKPKVSENVEDIIGYADKQLYLAKNNGRNRLEYSNA